MPSHQPINPSTQFWRSTRRLGIFSGKREINSPSLSLMLHAHCRSTSDEWPRYYWKIATQISAVKVESLIWTLGFLASWRSVRLTTSNMIRWRESSSLVKREETHACNLIAKENRSEDEELHLHRPAWSSKAFWLELDYHSWPEYA